MADMKKLMKKAIVFFYSSANPQTTTYFRDRVEPRKGAGKSAARDANRPAVARS